MKAFLLSVLLLTCFTVSFAQTEQAPIKKHELKYKDWTYQNIQSDQTINLREFTKSKKLVLVVYFAPWCHNWKREAPFAQKLYEKYKQHGFDVIGVGGYDTVEAIKNGIDFFKITFPVVVESDSKSAREKTLHYAYRRETGDKRKWGTPWNIILEAAELMNDGDTLTKKAFVANGELIEKDAEKFIREKLGLPAEESQTAVSKKPIEVCDETSPTEFKKP